MVISSRHLWDIDSLVQSINRRGTYVNPLNNGKFGPVDRRLIKDAAELHGIAISTEQKQHGPAVPTDLDRDAIARLQAAAAAELPRRGPNR